MKKNIVKGILVIGATALTVAVFALSGILPKQSETKKGSGTKDAVISKEIVIDDIEKMGVPVYEYVSKVIIEGEMGTGETLEAGPGPYEFGFWSDGRVNDPEILEPSSMAVDSKGNIYILDAINNRVQKYSGEGAYIKSIIVDGFSGKRLNAETIQTLDSRTMRAAEDPFDPSTIEVKRRFVKVVHDYKYRGINIVIDSDDNIYYYLVRNPGRKDEKGEVWQFKDDVVVKKWEGLPVGNLYMEENNKQRSLIRVFKEEQGVYPVFRIYDLIEQDFTGERCFHQDDLNEYEIQKRTFLENDRYLITKEDRGYSGKKININMKNGKRINININGDTDIYLPKLNDYRNELSFRFIQNKRSINGILITDISGNIKGIFPVKAPTHNNYWPFPDLMDKNRNVYEIIIDDKSGVLKVYKYEIVKKGIN